MNNKKDLDQLMRIKILAFKTVNCTAGVYCENLAEIRKIFNEVEE